MCLSECVDMYVSTLFSALLIALGAAEQQFLLPLGLNGRPFFRHAVFAPGVYVAYRAPSTQRDCVVYAALCVLCVVLCCAVCCVLCAVCCMYVFACLAVCCHH